MLCPDLHKIHSLRKFAITSTTGRLFLCRTLNRRKQDKNQPKRNKRIKKIKTKLILFVELPIPTIMFKERKIQTNLFCY